MWWGMEKGWWDSWPVHHWPRVFKVVLPSCACPPNSYASEGSWGGGCVGTLVFYNEADWTASLGSSFAQALGVGTQCLTSSFAASCLSAHPRPVVRLSCLCVQSSLLVLPIPFPQCLDTRKVRPADWLQFGSLPGQSWVSGGHTQQISVVRATQFSNKSLRILCHNFHFPKRLKVSCPVFCITACQCNGHSTCVNGNICDQCKNLTTGKQCEACMPGYYGDPTNGGQCTGKCLLKCVLINDTVGKYFLHL